MKRIGDTERSPASDGRTNRSGAARERLLRLAELLQNGAAPSSADLAERFGVTPRTIFRDISLLRRAGCRLRFDRLTRQYALEQDPIAANIEPRFSRDDARLLQVFVQGALHGIELRLAPTPLEPVLRTWLEILSEYVDGAQTIDGSA